MDNPVEQKTGKRLQTMSSPLIDRAKREIEEGDINVANEILLPLVGALIHINALFFSMQ